MEAHFLAPQQTWYAALMDPLQTTPITCLPWWHKTLAHADGRPEGQIVRSGCGTSGGNVTCAPEDMARHAGVDLTTYTLARYIASEVGSGPPEEKVAVAEAAVNRAKLEKISNGILGLLLYRQPVGHPNRSHFGPIHGPEGTSTAPYGRWAATSRDPTRGDLDVARMVLAGRTGFARGADDQYGSEYFTEAVLINSIKSNARNHDYWVGPLPNVNHWRLFLFTHRPDIAPTSLLGQWLTARGLAAVSDRRAPDWSGLSVCASPMSRGLAAALGVAAGAGLGWWLGPKIVPSIRGYLA